MQKKPTTQKPVQTFERVKGTTLPAKKAARRGPKVLIVGPGPVGATLSSALAQATNASARVIDSMESVTTNARRFAEALRTLPSDLAIMARIPSFEHPYRNPNSGRLVQAPQLKPGMGVCSFGKRVLTGKGGVPLRDLSGNLLKPGRL